MPTGLTARLFRGTVRPGQSAVVDEWMAMLNDRLDEAVATLDRERMGIEIVFRSREGDTEHLYWVVVRGAGEHANTSTAQLDIDHIAYDQRCREPGWLTAEAELLLLPDAVRAAVVEHCQVDDRRTP
ncbi:MAG: DUF6176 family protein [Ilumatobacteraceae bacterium]